VKNQVAFKKEFQFHLFSDGFSCSHIYFQIVLLRKKIAMCVSVFMY